MRAPSSDTMTALKKGPWSLEEDEMLKTYINKYGIWNWTHMPRFAGLSRTGKSCRLRWMNYLKPNVKRGNFSEEDEEIILHFHSILGNRWSAIASKLPERSDNEIKNYWHSHLKKRDVHKECEATEKNDVNVLISSEADSVDKKQKSCNQESNIFESLFSSTYEEDISSCSSSSTSKYNEVNFKADYYDIGSPGTVEDHHCFWKQICPSKNLDFGNIHQDMLFDPAFQDSYNDVISPYDF